MSFSFCKLLIYCFLYFWPCISERKIAYSHIQKMAGKHTWQFISKLSASSHSLKFGPTGFEITAGQRTMSELIWELTGQPFVLPVMLTGHIWLVCKWNKLKFPCCSVVSVVASRCVLSFAELWSEILGEMQQELLFTIRALKTDIGVHALPAHPS